MKAHPIILALAFAVAGPALAQTPEGPSAEARLQAAYKKEFAFLEAEKATLERRLDRERRVSDDEARTARIKLEAMQRELIALTVESDQLGETLVDLERQADVGAEGLDALDGLVQQMARSFESADMAWPPAELALAEPEAPSKAGEKPSTGAPAADGAREGDTPKDTAAAAADPTPDAPAASPESVLAARYAALLSDGFQKAGALAGRLGMVRQEKGQFFLADGRPVEGTLIRVGGVAIYGVSPNAAGALTPAGAGRFKLDPAQGEETARGLAAGAPPDTAHLFLFESAETNYEPREAKTPLQVVQAGGAIAWVIVGLGAFALLLMLLRAALLAASRTPVDRILQAVEPAVRQRRFEAVAAGCEQSSGAGARVMAAIARHLDADREDLERVFAERMLREEGRIDRFGSALMVIAAVAPLLGLLGTVTGMISTFDVITEFGTGNPKLLSGGISEALITTELGLIVAIPTLLVGNLLNGWATDLKSAVEQGALRLVNLARIGGAVQAPPSAGQPVVDDPAAEPAMDPAPPAAVPAS